MCLCGREVRVNIIRIGTEGSLRLSADEGIIQSINKGSDSRRERRAAGIPIVLDDPKAASVGIGG